LHWVVFALVGVLFNTLGNLGYKYFSNKPEMFMLTGLASIVSGSLILLVSILQKNFNPSILLDGKLLLIVLLTGTMSFLVMLVFVFGMTRGPFSLFNATWLAGMLIFAFLAGALLFQEAIGWKAILGGFCALVGIVLMSLS
jgi:drug/metabolite transporter (DMT)-like permease